MYPKLLLWYSSHLFTCSGSEGSEKENVGEEELNIIQQLVLKETDKETLAKDVDMMPAWMKRVIKPMLTA